MFVYFSPSKYSTKNQGRTQGLATLGVCPGSFIRGSGGGWLNGERKDSLTRKERDITCSKTEHIVFTVTYFKL
jgi:hypothetical protein